MPRISLLSCLSLSYREGVILVFKSRLNLAHHRVTSETHCLADAAQAFNPIVLYPYHYGDTDMSSVVALLRHNKGIEMRIGTMK